MQSKVLIRPALGTALLLSIPLVMSIVDRVKAPGDGWHWGPLDFVVMAALLFSAGVAYELIAARTGSTARRAAFGVAIAGVVLAIWVELAVGGISQLMAWASA